MQWGAAPRSLSGCRTAIAEVNAAHIVERDTSPRSSDRNRRPRETRSRAHPRSGLSVWKTALARRTAPQAGPRRRSPAARRARARRFTRSCSGDSTGRLGCAVVRRCPASTIESPLHVHGSDTHDHHTARRWVGPADTGSARDRRASRRDPVSEPVVDLPTHMDRSTHPDPDRAKRAVLHRSNRTVRRRSICRRPAAQDHDSVSDVLGHGGSSAVQFGSSSSNALSLIWRGRSPSCWT